MLNKEKPVQINFTEDCTKCGICAKSCPADYLLYENNEIIINTDSAFGCIQCGHCMMSCPVNAIKVSGEGILPEDVFELDNNPADYDRLYSLLAKRRSARNFKQQEIPQETIDKILQAAATGAISIPPYEVKVLVINDFDKVQEFAEDIVASLKHASNSMNPFVLKLFKPFIGKASYEVFNDFVVPLIKMTVDSREKGEDILFYNAPTVVVFYSSKIVENEDAIIASTLAQTAAESLGLGTCIIGTVPPAMNRNKKLLTKYGITEDEQVSTAFILGHPENTYTKGIKRRFKSVNNY